jgi:LPS export ABC transporter protein LptC
MRKKGGFLLFTALAAPQGIPNIEIRNLRIIESQDSQKHLELASDLGRVYRDQKLVELDRVLAAIYTSQGPPFQVQGESGLMSSQNNDFQVRDSVVVTSPDGYRILTNNIYYSAAAKSLETDESVNLETLAGNRSSMTLESQGLRVLTQEHRYELLAQVQAYQQQAGRSFRIRSQQGELQPLKSRALFRGRAQMRSPQMKLEGDLLEIQMSTSQQRIESIKMSESLGEGVRVVLDGIQIESQGFEAQFLENGELAQSQATDNARAETSDGVKIWAQRLTLVPTPGGQQQLRMQGQVRLDVQGRKAECEEAEMNPLTGDIVLRRFATVEREDQKITGNIIRLSTRNSEIEVEGAEGRLQKPPMELN